MSVVQIQARCVTCNGLRLFSKSGPNHVLHLLLSLVTMGLWLPVWIVILFCGHSRPYRCMRCGDAIAG